MNRSLFVILCSLLVLVPPLIAQDFIKWDDWSNVSTLRANQKVVVEPHKGMGKTVSGRFVGSDENGMTARTKRGEQRITRQSIRKVSAVRIGREDYATVGGILGVSMVGGGAVLMCTGREKTIWEPTPKRFWVGAGLAYGGAIAMLVGHMMGSPKRVYEAPALGSVVSNSSRKLARVGVARSGR